MAETFGVKDVESTLARQTLLDADLVRPGLPGAQCVEHSRGKCRLAHLTGVRLDAHHVLGRGSAVIGEAVRAVAKGQEGVIVGGVRGGLARPEQRNAIASLEDCAELVDALETAGRAPDLAVLILTGAGSAVAGVVCLGALFVRPLRAS